MTSPITPSRAAIYAQARRDNETEARESLLNLLLKNGLKSGLQIEVRGDLNFTTKVLITALFHLDPEAQKPHPSNRDVHSNSAEYNQARRSNEREVCECLIERIPEHILDQDFMFWSHLNPTTKVIIASTKYLEEFARSDVAQTTTVSSSSI